jgi:DtxR family Mn-dependent transcriptional regulator
LEVFLIQVMGFTWDQVDLEAHRLEHSISGAFEDRIDQICGYPTHCPHGDPIPRKDGLLPQETLVPIVELAPGHAGVLRRVGTDDARVLRYLSQLTLEPGCTLRLVDVAPFGGPVTLEILRGNNGTNDTTTKILGSELAAQLFVRLQETGPHGEVDLDLTGGVTSPVAAKLAAELPANFSAQANA